MKSKLNTSMNTLKSMLLSLIVLVGASGSPVSADSFNLNLRDGDLQALVTLISTATGKNFVLDKQVRGQKITIITGREIDEKELYETFLSVLRVHNLAAVETGELIKIIPLNKSKYQSVPVEEELTGIAKIDKKILKKQKKQGQDALITKVIKAEHVPVANMVPILRPMVSPTGHLQGYAPSNSIVVIDTRANIDKVTKLVRRMDRPDQDEMEVVELKFASAPELVKTIQGLQGAAQQKGVAIKYKVSADTRTNSVLVSGSKSGRQQVRGIIRRLDRPKVQKAEITTEVVYLRYAKAEDLAKVLSGTTATLVSKEATAKGGAGTQKADVNIFADAATNSLVIRAEPDIQKNLLQVIRRLDVRRAQVMVEAVIAEVSEDLSKSLGVQLGVFNSSGSTAPIAATSYPGSAFSLAEVVSGVLPAGVGMLLGIGGGEAGSTQFGALMNALSSDAATNILSTPTLVTMDNVEASMVIGQNVPFLTGSSSTANGVTTPFQTIERQDIGITLKIKPQINAGNSMMLKIDQEVSSLAASNASASDLITNKRSFSTQVMVEDGQLLVLGGLMEDTYRDTLQKVPVLGDLPFIGKAFRNTTTVKAKQNLMVFIHPMIMRDGMSGDVYTSQKYNRLVGAQDQSNILNRGILNRGAEPFPLNPEEVLSQGGAYESIEVKRQRQMEYEAELNRQQANAQTFGYQDQQLQQANVQTFGYNEQIPARTNRPLTLQERQQIAKQRELDQRRQVEARRRRAKQIEQERLQANVRRRQEAQQINQQRLQQNRQRQLQNAN
ncbi:MAG: type II secretion system secretin GspD [Leucothrix sp.]